jgi:hypothetical protein
MSERNTTQHDVWASGDAYEPFVGRWSRRVAREFIEWLAVGGNARWLSHNNGTERRHQTFTSMLCTLGVS